MPVTLDYNTWAETWIDLTGKSFYDGDVWAQLARSWQYAYETAYETESTSTMHLYDMAATPYPIASDVVVPTTNYMEKQVKLLGAMWGNIMGMLQDQPYTHGDGLKYYWGEPGTEADPSPLIVPPEFANLMTAIEVLAMFIRGNAPPSSIGSREKWHNTITVMRAFVDKLQFVYAESDPPQIKITVYQVLQSPTMRLVNFPVPSIEGHLQWSDNWDGYSYKTGYSGPWADDTDYYGLMPYDDKIPTGSSYYYVHNMVFDFGAGSDELLLSSFLQADGASMFLQNSLTLYGTLSEPGYGGTDIYTAIVYSFGGAVLPTAPVIPPVPANTTRGVYDAIAGYTFPAVNGGFQSYRVTITPEGVWPIGTEYDVYYTVDGDSPVLLGTLTSTGSLSLSTSGLEQVIDLSSQTLVGIGAHNFTSSSTYGFSFIEGVYQTAWKREGTYKVQPYLTDTETGGSEIEIYAVTHNGNH